MPLIKSKSDKAFKSNIKAEMAAGKPQKQAVAIAYSTKRAAKKAGGGDVRPPSYSPHSYDSDVDYYASLKKRPSSRMKSPPPLESTGMDTPQDRRVLQEQARMAKQKPMSKAQGMDFLKGVREGMEKMHQKKAKGGKVKKTNSCW
jgi:hypothetical protein